MSAATYARDLVGQIKNLQRRLNQEIIRAEYAERQVRQIAAERDLWKHQAQETEAALKSMGRAP